MHASHLVPMVVGCLSWVFLLRRLPSWSGNLRARNTPQAVGKCARSQLPDLGTQRLSRAPRQSGFSGQYKAGGFNAAKS